MTLWPSETEKSKGGKQMRKRNPDGARTSITLTVSTRVVIEVKRNMSLWVSNRNLRRGALSLSRAMLWDNHGVRCHRHAAVIFRHPSRVHCTYTQRARFPLRRPVTFRIPCFHLTCWPRASAGRPRPERGPRPQRGRPSLKGWFISCVQMWQLCMGVQRVHFHPAGYESDAGMRGSPGLNYFLYYISPQTRRGHGSCIASTGKNYPPPPIIFKSFLVRLQL